MKPKVRTLAAQTAFYVDGEDLKGFDPNDFDGISGQIVVRTHGATDLEIDFRMDGSGGVSFPGPTYPEGMESLFVRAFIESMSRMWNKTEVGDEI